jgi:hypothetical protein
MRIRRFVVAFACLTAAALSGCEQPEPAAPAAQTPAGDAEAGADYGLPPFVGKIWMSTTFGQPRGSMRIFLPDNTLLMDSCFETYRIVEWGVISEDTIRWREDTVPVQAQYTQRTPDSLTLKIAGADEVQTYVEASVPYVCPDMPR